MTKKIKIKDIVVSAILVDTIVMFILFYFNKGGKYVRNWYTKFTIGTFVMDVLSITIGSFMAFKLSNILWKQIVLVVIIGLINDMSFGYFIKNIYNKGQVLTLFKK